MSIKWVCYSPARLHVKLRENTPIPSILINFTLINMNSNQSNVSTLCCQLGFLSSNSSFMFCSPICWSNCCYETFSQTFTVLLATKLLYPCGTHMCSVFFMFCSILFGSRLIKKYPPLTVPISGSSLLFILSTLCLTVFIIYYYYWFVQS